MASPSTEKCLGKPSWTKPWLIGYGSWFCSIDFKLISICHLQSPLLIKLYLRHHQVTLKEVRVTLFWGSTLPWNPQSESRRILLVHVWLRSQSYYWQRCFLWDSLPIKWEIIPTQDTWQFLFCFGMGKSVNWHKGYQKKLKYKPRLNIRKWFFNNQSLQKLLVRTD